MNVTDAAERGRVSTRTIYRWIQAGRLRTTRVPLPHGHFQHDVTLDALIEAKDVAARTHCVHGHEFTEANTLWYKRWRRCRVCHHRTQAAARARRRVRMGRAS